MRMDFDATGGYGALRSRWVARRVASAAVNVRELAVPGAFELVPKQFGDERGVFLEWYRLRS